VFRETVSDCSASGVLWCCLAGRLSRPGPGRAPGWTSDGGCGRVPTRSSRLVGWLNADRCGDQRESLHSASLARHHRVTRGTRHLGALRCAHLPAPRELPPTSMRGRSHGCVRGHRRSWPRASDQERDGGLLGDPTASAARSSPPACADGSSRACRSRGPGGWRAACSCGHTSGTDRGSGPDEGGAGVGDRPDRPGELLLTAVTSAAGPTVASHAALPLATRA